MNKNLIVYFSRSGENYVNGQIVFLEKGNTEIAAQIIHEYLDSSLFQIETVHEYSKNYHECAKQAKKELEYNSRPKIIDYVHRFKDFDNIILCYPNWWTTMPMPLFTFLESHETKGKHIYPLCTHEGSGMGISKGVSKGLCSKAIVHDGLAIRGSQVNHSKNQIEKWLKDCHLGSVK